MYHTNVDANREDGEDEVLGVLEFSVLASQFFCKTKTVLKLKFYFKNSSHSLGEKFYKT